ncbi:hypothetical protein B0T16DRAFT_414605 [Cercophora newfieldiana]|uniref:Uncharacterized protein n=1 Tax=Cercophora newfieldiana TaxID=92897 RepID=A0AA40CPY9_9PEZI|nr:hypothetical protein B0T16DRAFT_414605 [Cercophora newfieldiana]
MGPPPDENLPEVVQPRPIEAEQNASPQVAATNDAWYGSDRDKYPALYDTSPKLVDDGTLKLQENTVSPQTPREFPSAGSNALPNHPSEPLKSESERTICGLRRRTFFIILAIISVLLLGAIIGGAVGGSLSNKSSSQTTSPPASAGSDSQGSPSTISSASSSSSSPSTTTSSTSSSSQPSPTGTQLPTLNNSTAPKGLAFQAFSSPSYLGSATPIVQNEGFHDLNISARSYVWLPDGTECCLTFCANRTTATGWWCNPRYRPDPPEAFARVYIWCGGNDGVKNRTCS